MPTRASTRNVRICERSSSPCVTSEHKGGDVNEHLAGASDRCRRLWWNGPRDVVGGVERRPSPLGRREDIAMIDTGGGGSAGGFAVDPDTVLHLHAVLDDLARALLEARRAEDRLDDSLTTDHSRPWTPPVAMSVSVPRWHDDLDRQWQHHHAALVRAQQRTAASLVEALHSYIDVDAHLANALHRSAAEERLVEAAAHRPGAGPERPSDDAVTTAVRSVDHAIVVWRSRRDHAADTGHALNAALAQLRWTGPAATAFTTWADTHMQQWQDMAEAADRVVRTLADTPADGSPTPAPRLDISVPLDIPPPTRPVDNTNVSTTPTLPGPIDDIDPTDPPAARPTEKTGRPANPDEREHLDDVAPMDASMAPHPVQDEPDLATAAGGTGTGPAAIGSAAVAGVAPPADQPATGGAPVPSAAMAGATALARAERDHHVIREIILPTTPPTPPPGAKVDDTVLTPPARRDQPATPTPGRPEPPPTGALAPGLGGVGPGTSAGRLPLRSRRRHTGRAPMWVNLCPTHPTEAWLDLTDSPGIGLLGAGADDTTRTTLHELLTHTDTLVIIPTSLLTALTETTEPEPALPLDGAARVHVVTDPFHGLTVLAENPTRACLLVLPAPHNDLARTQLTTALRAPRPAPAAAVLIGPWPLGSELDIDHDHRVHAHHRPGARDLTGCRLLPTSPAELLARLIGAASLNAPRPSSDDDPEVVEAKTGHDDARVPLALRVLGPVELRHHTDGEQVAITPLPRLARELLAWLAAHPDGGTRDHLVDTLCPDSTAKRPETTLYAALSRLRRLITDTTGGHAVDPIDTSDSRWRLDPDVVTIDYWTLLTTTIPAPDPDSRRRQLTAAVEVYRGLYAADLSPVWAHTLREAARRRHLEIINELVDLELRAGHDHTALGLLEQARAIEPTNEALYRSIMMIQLRAGHADDAHRTFQLLRAELDAIDTAPEPRTMRLLAPGTAPHTHRHLGRR
ncbi:bacterial transcriptional activator domain-containing protein [Pseudonocardia alni]|uniref:bacterial transcriptional activator domain-containing protein n=1 Tax=Pseudonocardia alni TaxID=33907 RepID=UPI0033F5624A